MTIAVRALPEILVIYAKKVFFIYAYTRTYIIHIYVHIHIRMYACICIYIHTHIYNDNCCPSPPPQKLFKVGVSERSDRVYAGLVAVTQ